MTTKGSPPVTRPLRRTKADIAAVVVLTVAVLVAAVLLWGNSDARGTSSSTGQTSVPPPPPATVLPASLAEAWRQPSGATRGPVIAGPSVVTGDGGEVNGRDPATGQVRWTY